MVRVTGVTEDKADIAQKNFVYARLFLSVGRNFFASSPCSTGYFGPSAASNIADSKQRLPCVAGTVV